MNTHAGKTRENKTRSVANDVAQRQDGEASAIQLADERPGVLAQRKMQEMADNSLKVRQLSALQAAADKRLPVKQTAPLRVPVTQRVLINLGNTQQEIDGTNYLRESDPAEFREGTIADLVEGEVLHLLSHSGGNTYGPFSPGKLADVIATILEKKQVDVLWNQLAIQLHGCESAGFAANLESELQKKLPFIQCQVLGIPGYSAITKEGENYSIGDTKGADELWDSIKLKINKNPTSKNLETLMSQQETLLEGISANLEQRLPKLMKQDLEGHESERERIAALPQDLENRAEKIEQLTQALNKTILEDTAQHQKDLERIKKWTEAEKQNSVIKRINTLRSTKAALKSIRHILGLPPLPVEEELQAGFPKETPALETSLNTGAAPPAPELPQFDFAWEDPAFETEMNAIQPPPVPELPQFDFAWENPAFETEMNAIKPPPVPDLPQFDLAWEDPVFETDMNAIKPPPASALETPFDFSWMDDSMANLDKEMAELSALMDNINEPAENQDKK